MTEDLPNVGTPHLDTPDLRKLEPRAVSQHAPRILLLYGSLRPTSYSRLLTLEAERKSRQQVNRAARVATRTFVTGCAANLNRDQFTAGGVTVVNGSVDRVAVDLAGSLVAANDEDRRDIEPSRRHQPAGVLPAGARLPR